MNSLKLKFKRKKSLIINNFDKFVNNNDKIDLNDKYFKSLLESFYSLQQNKIPANSIYNIMIDIHVLYEIPFVTIKIKEELDFSNNNQKELEMEKPLIKANVNLIEKTNSKNISFEPQYKMDSLSQKTISSIGFGNSKITNFQKIIKLKKGFCEKYVKIIVVISIICVLVVYVAILIYQLTVIENIFNIFFAFYANYIQRDKLINLHTSISSGFFVFLKLGNYSTIIDNDYFYLDFVLQKAQEFSKSYHNFYQNYIKYRFALGKDLFPFYVDYNFTKIRISWEEYTTQNNYLDESEVMVYNVIISCLGDITHFINNDFNLFFNSNYKRAQNTLLDSLYGNLFFYFSKNLQETFLVFFSNIQEEIDKAEND